MDEARHIPWTMWHWGRPGWLAPTTAPLVVGGAVLTCVPVVVVALGSHADKPVAVAFDALSIALLIGVGGYAWARRASRFGSLLVALGATVAVVSLSLSRDAGVYSAGRVAGFLVGTFVVYVIWPSRAAASTVAPPGS